MANIGRDELQAKIDRGDLSILLTYVTARVVSAGNTEAREEYMVSGLYTRP